MSTLNDRLAVAVRSRTKPAAKSDEARRWAPRKPASTPASISYQGMSDSISCIMVDRSSTGASLKVTGKNAAVAIANLPATFAIVVGNDRTVFECERVWIRNNLVGVRFIGGARHTPKPTVAPAKATEKRSKLAFWKR